ncbi:GNAT domain-containing protein [Cercophora newfieldiana]|uniref:GNAT domain-containing protein n=1 Tax=Cercophora newfieldiana TaxID=92897 RepID=A0AA39YGA5_9PEZI|nr:GNAT domain-containing protein [Cercophora newfieldiana]
MEDPAIQEATASDRLTLEEEYENQESWRASHDKLTFIICQPITPPPSNSVPILAGEVDAPEKMIGDVNFFLYPYDDDDDDTPGLCVGEVDIMIADTQDRGKGIGKAAVVAFLHYIFRNLDSVLAEYAQARDGDGSHQKLKMLMVKIKADNAQSIALFRGLGFTQEGDVNYFGEVKLVLREFGNITATIPDGYIELRYASDH